MRIRKNARISGFQPQSHMCEFNQSPWDVIIFPPELQANGGDHSDNNGNVSEGDSVGAVESVASMRRSVEGEDEKATREENLSKRDGNERKENGSGLKRVDNNPSGSASVYCNKADGKGWQCKREAKEGHTLCEHHLAQLRSYNTTPGHPSGRKSDKQMAAPKLQGRRGRKKASSSSNNPYEFYYYSGFGPRWGKRRGGKNNEANESGTKHVDVVVEDNSTEATTPSTSSQIDTTADNHQEFDLMDDEDDDEDNGDAGLKRARKPVKARSLKSLM